MENLNFLIWLLPILFIIHDFEEIIMMKAWITKNKVYLTNRFPKLANRMMAHFNHISTESFACGVAEEFIIISIITIVSYQIRSYYLWSGLFVAFTLHLFIHCIQAFIIRRYIPAIITSILCMPISIYICTVIFSKLPTEKIVLYTIISAIVLVINLIVVHKAMDIINKLLSRYEHNQNGSK